MTRSLRAVYENGVLRPLEPLNLQEHQQVEVIIREPTTAAADEDWLDTECLRLYAAETDPGVSLEAVRAALSKIPGSLTADFIAEREEE